MVDVKGMREMEGAVVLVCLRKKDATGRVATMAGWMTSAFVGAINRSEARMDARSAL